MGVGCLFSTILWSEGKPVPLKHVVESVFSGPFCFASADAVQFLPLNHSPAFGFSFL